MANWALVIGVDKYWTNQVSLKGAVRDALNVRQWLIDSGNVPEANITLLLGLDQNPVPPGIDSAVPTRSQIITAIRELIAKSGGRGDRFFFHFSGHGISTVRDYSLVEAIVCADFTSDDPMQSLSVRTILEFFAAHQFAEQFFFIDACRNVPWEEQFRVGDMPFQPKRDATRAPVQQFVMFAASPGVKAAEMAEAGNEQGAFTESLLKGLGGEGNAKAWDLQSDEYVVRFERLLQFVINDVDAKRKNVGENGRRLWQLPRGAGEKGSTEGSNPILAYFPADAFPKQKLDIAIDPFVASANPTLRVRGTADYKERSGIAAVPVAIELPPDDYRIRCDAAGYIEAEKKGWYVKLWQPQSVTVTLQPDPGYQEGFESLNFDLRRGVEDEPTTGSITVFSQDKLAPLELYDSADVLIASGMHELKKTGLPPGRYRAVLRMPGVAPVSQTIDLEAGEDEPVAIEAPQEAVGGVVQFSHEESDRTVVVSETSGVGPIAAPQLSTIITLAAGASLVDESKLGAHHLRAIGVRTFQAKLPQEESGTMLLVADETENAELARARVRMWPLHSPIAPARDLLSIRKELAEYAEPAQPGSYWISVEPLGERPLVFASAVVRRRVHMIVLARGADGVVQVFEYLPLTQGTAAHPSDLRRLEMLQRHYAAGSLARAQDLVELKFTDPTMGCLGGYMYLRLGQPQELDLVVQNMTGQFSELSDSWVLKGEYEAARGNTPAAVNAYRHALDRGVPLVLEGVARLRQAALDFGIDHPQVALLDRIWDLRVRDAIWTAWLPDLLIEGEEI